MIQFPFDEVDGLLSAKDREELRYLATITSPVQGVMAEIGSYKGLSALCLLSGSEKNILCFDWFEDEKFAEFGQSIDRAGMEHRTYVYGGDFKKRRDVADENVFSLVFVDHSHSLEDTIAAYEMFWPKISIGGVLAFHDYGHPDYTEATAWLSDLNHKRVLSGTVLAFVKE